MLDLIPDAFTQIDTRFLEPAAGNGNFLVAILERKIARIDEAFHGGTPHWFEFALMRCLASIYGVDIDDANVLEARERMATVIDAAHAVGGYDPSPQFTRAVITILSTNIVQGDSLNAAHQIVLVEYTPVAVEKFDRVPSELEPPAMDLFYEPPMSLPTVHFLELGA
ncbi:MAG: hypothetical protein RIC81_09110 [Microcella pacifica]|uniref:hypothetical protein n=1 Tax=Microcella pacifica TaxID=2591847 RepID=UPI001F3FB387|nr:hypothetical protein [Microcella pacifica]